VATEGERNRGLGAYSTPGVDQKIDPTFHPIGSAPEVKFRFTQIDPTTILYVTRDDHFRLDVRNSDPVVSINIHARQLLPDGTIHRTFQTFAVTSDRSINTFSFDLAEGFLLNLSIGVASNASAKYGKTFVAVRLIYGNVTISTTSGVLIAGYLAGLTNLVWPISQPAYDAQGTGATRSITGTTPAAGATNSDTVPTAAKWRLHSYKVAFTASAAVANREVALVITDGVNPLVTVTAAFTQVAGQAFGYQWSLGTQFLAPTVGTQRILPAPDMYLSAGFQLQTDCRNEQAGDQFSAAQFEVEEWIEGEV